MYFYSNSNYFLFDRPKLNKSSIDHSAIEIKYKLYVMNEMDLFIFHIYNRITRFFFCEIQLSFNM